MDLSRYSYSFQLNLNLRIQNPTPIVKTLEPRRPSPSATSKSWPYLIAVSPALSPSLRSLISLMEGSLDLPPWVDLPDPFTELILEHLPLSDYIRLILRHSPHPPPMGTHPLPWLIPRVLSLSTSTGFDCCSPLERRLRHLRFPTTPTFAGSNFCIASTRGWLLMLNVDEDYEPDPIDDNPTLPLSRRTFLFNPLTSAVISLPMLSILPGGDYCGALSSPPFDPDCTVLLLSDGSVFLCRRSNDPGDCWTMVVEIEEEWIDSVVYCGGKFYCVSRKGVLFVIDHVCSTPTVLCLTMDVSALDLRDGDMCRLVEFGGELLLVVALSDGHGDFEGFQVFSADLSGEKWLKKMDMLDDHVLFLDEFCSLSLLASDVSCKKNCIYSTLGRAFHVWMVFDLDARNWIHGELLRHDEFSDLQYCPFHWGFNWMVCFRLMIQGLDCPKESSNPTYHHLRVFLLLLFFVSGF